MALRVLVEKLGLPGYSPMPDALTKLSRQERSSFCNDHWGRELRRLALLEFSRDRKMMSVLVAPNTLTSPVSHKAHLREDAANKVYLKVAPYQ